MSKDFSVYRFYDANDQLLYVGLTGRGMQRTSEHANSKVWWTLVRRSDVRHFGSQEEAAAAEIVAIRSEQPRFNILHQAKPPKRSQTLSTFEMKLDDPFWGKASLRERKRRWYEDLSSIEKKLSPCVACGLRGLVRHGPMCDECFEVWRNLEI